MQNWICTRFAEALELKRKRLTLKKKNPKKQWRIQYLDSLSSNSLMNRRFKAHEFMKKQELEKASNQNIREIEGEGEEGEDHHN